MKGIGEDTNKRKVHLLTVLKFGKSPTAELLSTGKDINGLISSEGCIIRVGVRTRAGSGVVWQVLPAKNKTKRNSIFCSYPSPSPTYPAKIRTAELQKQDLRARELCWKWANGTGGENSVKKGLLAHDIRQWGRILPDGKAKGCSDPAGVRSTRILLAGGAEWDHPVVQPLSLTGQKCRRAQGRGLLQPDALYYSELLNGW